MSRGPTRPHKDTDFSPPSRAAGRSNNPTPQSEQEQRDLIRNVIQRASQSLESLSHQPNMPERAHYPSHEAWLRALLTRSLQQSEEAQQYFDADENNNNNGTEDQEGGNVNQEPEGESKEEDTS